MRFRRLTPHSHTDDEHHSLCELCANVCVYSKSASRIAFYTIAHTKWFEEILQYHTNLKIGRATKRKKNGEKIKIGGEIRSYSRIILNIYRLDDDESAFIKFNICTTNTWNNRGIKIWISIEFWITFLANIHYLYIHIYIYRLAYVFVAIRW